MTKRKERDYLEGSWVVSAARKTRAAAARRWNGAWERFLASRSGKAWRKSWFESPLRWVGTAVVSAVLANGFSLFLLRKETGTRGMVLRGLFLLAGLAAYRCRGDWDSVRDGSFFLRALFPREKR